MLQSHEIQIQLIKLIGKSRLKKLLHYNCNGSKKTYYNYFTIIFYVVILLLNMSSLSICSDQNDMRKHWKKNINITYCRMI